MTEEVERISAQALYEKLATARAPYLTRARRAAELTVPALMPKEGASATTNFPEPAQGLGARGLRHLSSKLNITLFPVNQPFFRYEIDAITGAGITKDEQQDPLQGMRGEMEKALSARTRAVMAEINGSMFRPISFEACRQLVMSGNYCTYIPKEGKPKGYKLDTYVVERDGSGNLIRLVIREMISPSALPLDVQAKVKGASSEGNDPGKDVTVYTAIVLDDDGQNFTVWQEANGINIGGEYEGTYPADQLPWVPLRFSYVEGEDYGRSFVDEYVGDLNALEQMTIALRDGTIQGAKVIWMVSPNSTVNIHKLAKAENGDFVQGEANAVTPLRLEKQADFAVAERYIAQLTERLSFAFLLNTAIQRNGERVTAEEIRYMAGEIDQGLGGVFSLLAEEFQQRVVRLFELRMEHRRKVPPLPKDVTSLSIVTGLDALGRGNDLQNLDALVAGAAQVVGPEAVARYLGVGEYFKRRGAALGIDMDGLIRTEEEIQAAEQQAQLQQMAQHLGPQAIAQMGGAARDQMKADQANQQASGEQNG